MRLLPLLKRQLSTSAQLLRLTFAIVLIFETLWLTIRFDAANVPKSSPLIALLGWSPLFLRFAICSAIASLLFGYKHFANAFQNSDLRVDYLRRLLFMVGHFSAFIIFTSLTAVVMGVNSSHLAYPSGWALLWIIAGLGTVASWGLAMLPLSAWGKAAKKGRRSIGLGLIVGLGSWVGAFLTQKLWVSLTPLTFHAAEQILGILYPHTVSQPAKLTLGTPSFAVTISPECSGFEGIALIVLFLTVYLWQFRNELRFPHAFLLLPLGAVAIWTMNLLRIVGLISIGTSGWPEIALGGFHSQAGWLAFNAIALTLVVLTRRVSAIRSYLTSSDASVLKPTEPITAYLSPFLLMLTTAMVTAAFSADFDWFYPARVVVAVIALGMFRKAYGDLRPKLSLFPIASGAVVFCVWVALSPPPAEPAQDWLLVLRDVPFGFAASWFLFRIAGYVVIVPLVEEIAFRGFLTRRIIQETFNQIPIGTFSWPSFLISSLLFGAAHGKHRIGAIIAGVLFGLALYYRRRLSDAAQAHGVANALIAAYASVTGRWDLWG